jgi:hydrogenase-4 component B
MNASLAFTLVAAALALIGAFVALAIPERAAAAWMATIGALAAALALLGAADTLLVGASDDLTLWTFPTLGAVAVGTTSLAAWFACVSALVYVPVSIFTLRYVQRYAPEYSMRGFAFWYCMMLFGVVSLFICRDVVSFFLVWEVVAIASSMLVAFEWRRFGNARAAFVMLGMSEAGTMAALLGVLLARHGSLLFGAPVTTLGATMSWCVFLLSFVGFGVKAGLLPINSWLPRAHPLAPGNVSALLSGVMLNLGVYGIVLVNAQLAPVRFTGEGVIVMLVGTATALVGILYATIDDDLKAMLAYSSIENLGIAVTAFGAAFVFMVERQPLFAALGFAAGLYHLANHSAYKGLLFLGAATVDARLGTRSMNALGGVIRVLPVTTAMFFVGVLAIAAIPPLNGFVSEWMTLQALLRAAELAPLTLRAVFALCGAGLALTAALAVTCFVKAFGMTFLGPQRTPRPAPGEAPFGIRLAMGLLALECVLLGVLPTYVLPAIDHASSAVLGSHAVAGALVPPFFRPEAGPSPLPSGFVATFHALGAQLGQGLPGRGLVVMLRGGPANPVVFAMSTTYLVAIIAVLLGVAYVLFRLFARRKAMPTEPWAGGLRRLPPEMTYTATGFSNPVRAIFDAVFRPARVQNERQTIHEHFRSAIRRRREDVFLADRLVNVPIARVVERLAATVARMHHGRLPSYVGYALGALIVALAVVRWQ